MKRLLQIALCFCFGISTAQKADTGTIELQIKNIENNNGQILIGVYEKQEDWLKKIYVAKASVINKGKAAAVFEYVPSGTYAISVFHDEDNDGKLDTFLGIPTETTGASNNAPANFGPPKWQDAKFKVEGETVKQIIILK